MTTRTVSNWRAAPPLVTPIQSGTYRAATASPNAWLSPAKIIAGSISQSMGGGAANAIPTAQQTAAMGSTPGAYFGPTGVAGAPVIFGLSLGQVALLGILGVGVVYVLTR